MKSFCHTECPLLMSVITILPHESKKAFCRPFHPQPRLLPAHHKRLSWWHLLMRDALPTCCLKVNWRGWWAARGQWERSGAESTLRLYYSVVPLPAADASPAHSRSSASSSGSWIIQFPSKCNISWRCSRRISIRATAWSYRYDLHALPLLSAFFFFLSSLGFF